MTNYYTYIEEQKDDEVPGASILKLHKLPELPQEILDMILYKFGGLQHPAVKTYKSIKNEVEDCGINPYNAGGVIRNSKLYEVMANKHFLYHYPTKLDTCEYYSVRRLMFLFLHFNHGQRNRYFTNKTLSRLEEKENRLVYKFKKLNIDDEWVDDKEWWREDIKFYLDVNKIEYKKSWSRTKLIKQAFSF